MNILILTSHLNPGGVPRYVINLAKGFKNLGDKVFISSYGGLWIEELNNLNIEHKRIPINTKLFFSYKILLSFFYLIPFIKREKIEVIHSNTRVTQSLGYLLYKFFKIPYVSAYHGFYKNSLMRRMYKFSGVKTIAVSRAVKEHLSRDLAIEPDKITVVHNGIDKTEFANKLRNCREVDLKEDDIILGILGRISQEKGHFLALDTLALLIKEYPNLYLLVCGKGKLEEKLKTEIKNRELAHRVKFIDWSANDFLDIVNILLVPSKKEGFGYAVVEAFTKSVPVIGFNVGGIAEIIKDKVNGLLFYDYTSQALRERIVELMRDRQLLTTIINNAKEDSNYYVLERMVKETRQVYIEAIKICKLAKE